MVLTQPPLPSADRSDTTTYAVLPTALWVIPVSELGGVARHVLDVARVGIPGHRLVVLCPEGALADALRVLGTAVVTAPLGPGAGVAASVRSVRRAVRTLAPAVVHSHLSHADVVCSLALAGSRTPALVSTEHGIAADDSVYQSSRFRARVMAGVHTARLRRVDAAVAVSEATAVLMRRTWHADGRLRVVLNGVDRPAATRRRSPVPPAGPIQVISLSRLSPEKGLLDLVASFDVLRRLAPAARLTLAGDGELRTRLAEEVRSRGLVDHVSMPGHVDPADLLAQGDVLVQLSRSENASYSVLDAVTHGLGVVATPVGGNREILPASALLAASDHDRVARAVLDQAGDLDQRPVLPQEWPTVAQMTASLADVYDEVTR